MPYPALKAGSRPPWVGLAAAVWVEVAAGNGFNFPLYSSALKSVLNLNQQQITLLGVANDIGESVGMLPGIACNKFPPWALVLIGALLCFLGYGVLWLAASQTVTSMPYLLLWFALCVATNSVTWLGTAVLVTNMRNFPLSRGTITSILKGYGGISGAVYTVIYSMVLEESASGLLLFLAVGLPVVSLSCMYFIRPCAPPSGEDSSVHIHFLFAQAAIILLAIYLVVITAIKELVSINDAASYSMVAIMIVFLLSPLSVPLKMTLFRADSKKSQQDVGSSNQLVSGDDEPNGTDPLLTPSSSANYLGSFYECEDVSEIDMLLAVGEGAVKRKRKPKRGEDFKIREALIKADFWLLWFICFLGIGSGVTVLNNLAQIGLALGVQNTTILLSVFSFCNFLGRFGAGTISEHFVRSRTLPRTFWMTCTLILMTLACFFYTLAFVGTLYTATALMGISYGAMYCITIPTISELFGLKHFGIISSFFGLSNPIGAVLFSVLLASHMYDAEADKQGASICNGPQCFRFTFLILAGTCGLGTILSIILTVRIKPVYQMLYAGGSFYMPQSSSH